MNSFFVFFCFFVLQKLATTLATTHKSRKYDAILLDIEGTTTPISFVKNTLFSYVRNNLSTYLTRTWESEQTKKDVIDIIKYSHEQNKYPQLTNYPNNPVTRTTHSFKTGHISYTRFLLC